MIWLEVERVEVAGTITPAYYRAATLPCLGPVMGQSWPVGRHGTGVWWSLGVVAGNGCCDLLRHHGQGAFLPSGLFRVMFKLFKIVEVFEVCLSGENVVLGLSTFSCN